MTRDTAKVKAWRERTKQLMLESFGSSCGICGYARSPAALHFHHVDRRVKDFTFGQRLYRTWDALVAEMRKCVLLCANCHSEVHAGVTALPDDIRRFDENYVERESMRKAAVRQSCLVCGVVCPTSKHKFCSAACWREGRKTSLGNPRGRPATAWPSAEDLELEVLKTSYVSAAARLGVSDNTVRKYLAEHGRLVRKHKR
jgi:hypothetical protein